MISKGLEKNDITCKICEEKFSISILKNHSKLCKIRKFLNNKIQTNGKKVSDIKK